jgi:N-acetylneuraminate lyase
MAKLAQGIWPALCTPFDDSGAALAPHRVEALVNNLIEAGAAGFFVTGGTGEGAAMSPDERRLMAETTAAAVAGRVPIILQVGACPTADAVELALHAATIKGINAVGSVAPIDAPNDLKAAAQHYTAIGAATDLPFYVYWLARTSDTTVGAAQYLEALAAVPNFSGVKFTDTNFYLFQQLVDLGGGRLNMISGPDEMCLAGMVMGADAAIGSTYNIMPRLFISLLKALEEGRVTDAMLAQTRANRVISLLIEVGVLGGIKAMLGWRGLPVGPPRAPNTSLSPAQEEYLRRRLDELDFEVA